MSTNPRLLSDSRVADAVNVQFRDAKIRTRPRFVKSCDLPGTGRYMGGIVYQLDGSETLVFCRGKKAYRLQITDGQFTELGEFPSQGDRYWFVQADRFIVIQNGLDRPMIIDGNEWSFARPYVSSDSEASDDAKINQVYTGYSMAYGHGRLFTVPRFVHGSTGMPSDQRGDLFFVAGDVRDNFNPEYLLRMLEDLSANGGGAIGSPYEMGVIRALKFYRNPGAPTGIGELVGFADRGVFAFTASQPREVVGGGGWADSAELQILFFDVTANSDRAIIPVNNDLLFRATDGIRSMRYTAADAAGNRSLLSATPISREVAPLLSLDQERTSNASMCFAGGRVFATTGGLLTGHPDGDGFRCLATMDVEPSYTLTEAATPIFEGAWTGMNVFQTLSIRVFGKLQPAFIGRVGDTLGVWLLSDTEVKDAGIRSPVCRIVTPLWSFGSFGVVTKVDRVDVRVEDQKTDLIMRVYIRPEGTTQWYPMGSSRTVKRVSTNHRDCIRFTFPNPDDLPGDPGNGYLKVQNSTAFQFMIEWEGVATISLIKPGTDEAPEVQSEYTTDEEKVLDASVDGFLDVDMLDYEVTT